jgi:hypothetical protein
VVSDLYSIDEEADGLGVFALTIAESLHELVEFGGSLDLEEDFVVAIGDLYVEVLATSGRLRLCAVGGLFVIRHCREMQVTEKIPVNCWTIVRCV